MMSAGVRMRARLLPAAVVLVASCSTASAPVSTPSDASAQAQADSIVLERTRCFGTCPAYRLRIGRDGAVRFESRNPNEPAVHTDTIDAGAFQWLLAEAARIGFYDLPDDIDQDDELCPGRATDHPTHITTIYADPVKRVDHYTGCLVMHPDWPRPSEALAPLTRFESAIDSVAGASRWIRPYRR
jgi:hypothetical protein